MVCVDYRNYDEDDDVGDDDGAGLWLYYGDVAAVDAVVVVVVVGDYDEATMATHLHRFSM